MSVVGIIPARLDSTRLPRKLLLDRTGYPLIQHTYERACAAERLDAVYVATDSPDIARAVKKFGGEFIATGAHWCGTDRVAEAVRRKLPDAELIVNIQGDEPEIDPSTIDQLVKLAKNNPDIPICTLATALTSLKEVQSSSVVKVVRDAFHNAMYFSRLPIHALDLEAVSYHLRHIGIYSYQREALEEFIHIPQAPPEKTESLEQLRALWMGWKIKVGLVDHAHGGIDTPEDYERFCTRFNAET
jgi:3-deoxy-manno-octulosonate cytidylyltransferase (CMP-KDO synthetase)